MELFVVGKWEAQARTHLQVLVREGLHLEPWRNVHNRGAILLATVPMGRMAWCSYSLNQAPF